MPSQSTHLPLSRLLASLSSRLCESRLSTIVAAPPTTDTTELTSTEGGGGGSSGTSGGEMTISSYLLEHVVAGTHLRDRLGMQRFIGSLLLAAWPPATISIIAATIGAGANSELPNRLNSCLTNVVYYEEILGEVVLPSTFLFVCMLAHRSLHSYVHPSRHLPIHPSINSSRAAYFPPPVSSIFSNCIIFVHASNFAFIYSYVYPFTHPPVFLHLFATFLHTIC